MMSESEFYQHIDATLEAIEEAIEESGAEIEYENAGGVLTLVLENGTQLILNRQTPVRQLWLATRRDGLHFDWDEASGRWRRDTDGSDFVEQFNKALVEQGGEPLDLA
jgi:CyaY protein